MVVCLWDRLGVGYKENLKGRHEERRKGISNVKALIHTHVVKLSALIYVMDLREQQNKKKEL
jgi:hypothetical protein